MTEFRVKSYYQFENLPMPEWGPDLSEIDFAYSDLLAVYDVIKDLVTADTIKDFCGITTEEQS